MNIVNVIWKHHARNRSEQMPEGLLFLGKTGRILYSPFSEMLAFITIFLFLIVIHWLFQKNITDEKMGIKTINLLGIILSLMIYDSYTKNYYTNLNLTFIKIFPYSFLRKICMIYFFEFFNLKLVVLLFYLISTFIYSYNLLYDNLLGVSCFIFYTLISVVISLFQLRLKYKNSTAINYLFSIGYLGTWVPALFLKNYLLFLIQGSILLIVISIFLFKMTYDKNAFLCTQD